jgi:hypothetical protein
MPIAIAMLLVASHMAHPIPDPAIALKRTTIASERTDGISFGFRFILFILSMRFTDERRHSSSRGSTVTIRMQLTGDFDAVRPTWA